MEPILLLVLPDTFVFRLQTQLSHIQFTVAVSVDLNNKGADRLNVNVISENYPRGYVPFTDTERLILLSDLRSD